MTEAHIDAIRRFMTEAGIAAEDVSLIGFHGQTVYHRPEVRFTRQLGLGEQVAEALGIDTVYRFRHADVASGGEGAPFVPLYHRALASSLAQPVMILNLGGVGNVTYIDGDTVIAFDTGPASALLDDFVLRRRGLSFDENGQLAASGKADAKLVAEFMTNPFFDRPAPKSLDRQDFHARAKGVEALSDADGAATLAEFTVESVVAALRHVPRAPQRWLVTGGGRRNAHFMTRLHERAGRRRRSGRGGRLGRRFPGGAGLRLSRRALDARPALEPADHHRRAASDARRRIAPRGLSPSCP